MKPPCGSSAWSYGKPGELIAYDVLRAERIDAGGRRTGSVAEFIADFTADFTAQLRQANLRCLTG